MCEATTQQLRVELKHGKKEAKVLLQEAQWEYESQCSHHFIALYIDSPKFCSHVQSFISYKIFSFSLFQTFHLEKHFMTS